MTPRRMRVDTAVILTRGNHVSNSKQKPNYFTAPGEGGALIDRKLTRVSVHAHGTAFP